MDYLKMSELYHHGIKGQKWGLRRFQYEDGSLTPEGKVRYGGSKKEELYYDYTYDKKAVDKKLNDISRQVNESRNLLPKEIKDKKIYNKKYEDLSTEELQRRIQRLNAERQYSDLIGDTKIKKSGLKIASELLQTVGAGIAIVKILGPGISKLANTQTVKKLVNKGMIVLGKVVSKIAAS